MVQINFAQKEIQCKIVYYGPGMSGKTTNLELVHGKVPEENRGELTSIATTGERTLYFDYMPLDLGQIAGIQTKFQLYTVPGQIYYKSTRRLVLQGVDGIVFVADSSAAKLRENKESLQDLEDNLEEMGKTLQDVPIIIQYNKRDLPDAMSIEELEDELNPHGFEYTEAVANKGDGVFPTLKQLSQSVLEAVNKGGFAASKPKRAPRPTAVKSPNAAAGAGAPTPAPVAAAAAAAPNPAISRPVGGATYDGPSSAPPAHPPASRTPPAPSGGGGGDGAGSNSYSSPTTTSAGALQHTPSPGEYQTRSFDQRVVKVSGLGGGTSGGKILTVVGLAALIAGVAFFILTQVL